MSSARDYAANWPIGGVAVAFGRRADRRLTGADYLLGISGAAVDGGKPFAREFADMVMSSQMASPLLLREVIASRPLKAHEATPVTIVVLAVEAALKERDVDAAIEALRLGAALLAKWPDYLDGGIDGHPELTARDQAG